MKKLATQFERKIKQFLENLEFNDVDGARDNFMINGIQVDVCGGWENALLVIECKSARELKKKSLRDAINILRGKIPLLEKGFKEHPTYNKYDYFRYIIATRNIKVRHEDIIFANQSPRIYIWNEDFIDYYEELYNFLNPYAKFSILGEMGIKPVQQNPISVPAFKVNIGGMDMYNFVMNPKDLLSVSYVARRERREERYYQRILNKNRLKSIKKYIDEENGTFPNNIIISFRPDLGVKFKPIKEKYSATDWPYLGVSYGILEFPRDYRSCWIIDGQHRLYAFANTQKWFNMPITAFDNIDLESQCKFFLDINKNQKPVDPDLLWDLNGDMIPSKTEGIISNIVKNLNQSGPLFHKIFYPSVGIKKKKGLIKISAMCISIKKRKLVDPFTSGKIKNPFYDENHEKIVKKLSKSLSEYFEVLQVNLKTNWDLGKDGFILTNGGIGVFIGLFEKISERVMQQNSRIPNREDMDFYVKPLIKIFKNKYDTDQKELKSLRLRCTSEGGKQEVLEEFIRRIKTATHDDKFGGEISSTKYMEEFTRIEGKIKELIKNIFYDSQDENWFKNKVADKGIYGRALKKLKKNGMTDMNKIYLEIGFGDCFHIMRVHKEIFYPFFIGNEDFNFLNESTLQGAISHLTLMRGKCVAHSTETSMSEYDEIQLKVELEKMNKCIDKALKKFSKEQ